MRTQEYYKRMGFLMRSWRSVAFVLIALLGAHTAFLVHFHQRSIFALVLEHTTYAHEAAYALVALGFLLIVDVACTFAFRELQAICRPIRPVILIALSFIWLMLSFVCAKSDAHDGRVDFLDVYIFWSAMGIACLMAAIISSLHRYYENKHYYVEVKKDVEVIG